MAATIGHIKVPLLITISAGSVLREIANVATDLKLSITGETAIAFGAGCPTRHHRPAHLNCKRTA